MVVLRGGDARNAFECRFVEAHEDRHAIDIDRRAGGGAETHGEDAHAVICRHTRRIQRVWARGAPAIGQQDDRRRRERSRRDNFCFLLLDLEDWSSLAGQLACPVARSEVVTEHGILEIDALVGKDRGQRHDDPAANGGVPLQLKAVDGGHQFFAVARRRLHQ